MKNNFKKIIVGIISFATLFMGVQNVFAAGVTWNTASNDCKGLSIINVTTGQGYSNPCTPLTSISASAGDVINVRIYYHNTGTVTANNTHLVLIPNSSLQNPSTSKFFYGRITSDQGSFSFRENPSVNISSSQSLTFMSAKWYTENTNTKLTPLLNGQTGSEVLTDAGLNIGSITAGWPSQGSLVVAFRVSNNVAPQLCQDPTATNYGGALPCRYPPTPNCLVSDFSASPKIITKGNSSTLSWNTSNCTSVNITNVGNVSNSGSRSVTPSSTTTYNLVAVGANNIPILRTATVTVNNVSPPPAIMTGSLNASNSSCVITEGNGSCNILFSWATQNPEATSSVTHAGGMTVATGNNGSQLFSIINGSDTYYLYNNAKLLDSETVTASCASGTSWNGSSCVKIVQDTCVITGFSANPSTITSGSSSNLNWSTNNCVNVSISSIGNVGNSGSRAVYPTSTTGYTLTAHSVSGGTNTLTTIVYVNQVPPPQSCDINNFTASPSSIDRGDASVLNWSTTNCTSVIISNLPYNVPTSGSQAVYPTNTKTYTLTAYGSNGLTQNRSVTVYVEEEENDDDNCSIDSFTASDTSIDDGDSTTLHWNTTDCDRVSISKIGNVDDDGSEKVYPSKDTTYTLTAYNTNGSTETESLKIYVNEDDDDDNNNEDECYINSFTANKIYINSGDSVTLRWTTTDCDDIDISGVDNNLDDDGSETVYPTSTRTYTLRAEGDEGSDSRSITINVNYVPVLPPVTPIYNASVVTTVATNISQTGAQVNGLITSSDYNNANVYFEYGTTVNLGARTASRTTNGNTNFSDYLTNLSPNTIYYFQALSSGTNGISRGSIQIFKTLGYTTGVVTPTVRVIQGTTITSSSPIMLRIENRYQTIGIGDIVDYTVYYKNISNSRLTNPMVQVYIPQGITLVNTSIGTYSASDRTLSAPIADLNPGDEGVIYLQGRVDDMDINSAQIVTTAILVYTNPNGAQENAMAYVLNNPKVMNLLGASAFFGNVFGMSLVGLLLLILFILILVLIARSLSGRHTTTTTTEKIVSH